MRLSLPPFLNELQTLRIYYIPIEIDFIGDDKNRFNKNILDYIATHSSK